MVDDSPSSYYYMSGWVELIAQGGQRSGHCSQVIIVSFNFWSIHKNKSQGCNLAVHAWTYICHHGGSLWSIFQLPPSMLSSKQVSALKSGRQFWLAPHVHLSYKHNGVSDLFSPICSEHEVSLPVPICHCSCLIFYFVRWRPFITSVFTRTTPVNVLSEAFTVTCTLDSLQGPNSTFLDPLCWSDWIHYCEYPTVIIWWFRCWM